MLATASKIDFRFLKKISLSILKPAKNQSAD
jgi:hypothetical protein